MDWAPTPARERAVTPPAKRARLLIADQLEPDFQGITEDALSSWHINVLEMPADKLKAQSRPLC